jgi:hypothetical protein
MVTLKALLPDQRLGIWNLMVMMMMMILSRQPHGGCQFIRRRRIETYRYGVQ